MSAFNTPKKGDGPSFNPLEAPTTPFKPLSFTKTLPDKPLLPFIFNAAALLLCYTPEDLNCAHGMMSRLTLGRELGRGDSGVVRHAVLHAHDRAIYGMAVKFQPYSRRVTRKTFRTMGQQLQALYSESKHRVSHQAVFAMWEVDAGFYSLMPHHSGQALKRPTRASKRSAGQPFLTAPLIMNMLHDVAKDLVELHANHFVHLDVRPQNILHDRDTHDFKLVDYGLLHSTWYERSDSLLPPLEGDGEFMSQKTLNAKTYRELEGGRCDVYSLLKVAECMLDPTAQGPLESFLGVLFQFNTLTSSFTAQDILKICDIVHGPFEGASIEGASTLEHPVYDEPLLSDDKENSCVDVNDIVMGTGVECLENPFI